MCATKKLCPLVTPLLTNVLLLAASLPVYFVLALWRTAGAVRFARVARSHSWSCRTCGVANSFLGFWRCSCGFCYRGHLLRICPLCHSLPAIRRCERCGATEMVRR